MINDIRTVIWKEMNEFIHQRGSVRLTAVMVLIPAFILGIMFPLQAGREWVETPVSIIPMALVPLFLVVAMIADSFAGERERHTLETLLASRLPDKAILIGKILSAMFYALCLTVLFLAMGIATVNIAYGDGSLLLFPVSYLIYGAVFSILAALFASSAGVLVSLRASTVRQAHQVMSLSILAVFFLPTILIQFLPDTAIDSIETTLNRLDVTTAIAVFFIGLAVADILLLLAAAARFKRSRMMFD